MSGELSLKILMDLRREMCRNCAVCKGVGTIDIHIWRTLEDQLNHMVGDKVTPMYTATIECGACGGVT